MTSRERITTILTGGVPDRVGIHESFWSETVAAWREQGLPEDQDPHAYFDTDIRHIGIDLSLQLPSETIEETDHHIIMRDANGVTRKTIKGESGHTPHWMDHTIKTKQDWLEHKHRFVAKEDRIPANFDEACNNLKKTGKFIALTTAEPYEANWSIPGQVRIFTWMMDDPDLVADIFNTYTDMMLDMIDMVIEKGYDFDGVWFWGDMGYRNATLFSPQIYDDLIFPCHKRICAHLKGYNKPSILHSCGKIEVLIPKFIEAGFDAIQPIEAKTGMDVRDLKRRFGNQITFFGNMDVRRLSGSKQDVEEEVLGKLPAAMKDGGYIFHSDHSVPPTVSFENYCHAYELVKEHGRYE